MYLEHFGLNEPPFKITPVTDFFFPGANRLEILDALLYAITDSEGIIKVTGEVGSGKTMLCRMLLERAPEKVEAVYLANPSLSREEMLYAIADGLKLNLEGQRVNIILQTLQNHLELKIAQGKRVVILVDEAHAMPLETMEELRLLYNLQVGSHKLLHIVLFGQPELNDKLSQPNMRQLKDRIIHHFSMLPLSQNIIESYLLFRMRTAGYRGPSPFANTAAALIGKASQGLMRRVNILADKALLAAFVENTHAVELRHVQAAIQDSELSPMSKNGWLSKTTALYVLGFALAILIAGASWMLGSRHQDTPVHTETKPYTPPSPSQAAITLSAALPAPVVSSVSAAIAPAPPPQTSSTENATPPSSPPSEEPTLLLTQRLEAAQNILAKSSAGTASIQLYYTNEIRTARIEKFLKAAELMGKLQEIYILPIRINSKQGLRVLYGIYTNSKEARLAMQHLPKIYQEAYAPSIFVLDE